VKTAKKKGAGAFFSPFFSSFFVFLFFVFFSLESKVKGIQNANFGANHDSIILKMLKLSDRKA